MLAPGPFWLCAGRKQFLWLIACALQAQAQLLCLMPDYYRQLGISGAATDAQVRRAVRRYWQHVARYRPASEQQAFLTAATVLSNPHLRAVYDPAYRLSPEPARQQAASLRHLSGQLRTELHQAQARAYRLENEVRSLRLSLGHALNYPEEMSARRHERRRQWGRLALGGLLLLVPGLLHGLWGSGASGLATMSGPRYEPVGEGVPWLLAKSDTAHVYTQAEVMPQFAGGLPGLREELRQRVYARSPSLARAERLCATGQLRFVVDSAGWPGPVQVLGLPPGDSAGQRVLRAAGGHLPRCVPGYQRARPVAVRLTVPLAD